MDKILKFSATWCGPCKTLSQTLNGFDLGVDLEEIDIDAQRDLVVQYGVRSVPTLIYLRDEVEVSRMTGANSVDEIKSWVSGCKK